MALTGYAKIIALTPQMTMKFIVQHSGMYDLLL